MYRFFSMLLACACLVFHSASFAQESPGELQSDKVVIVLDASGSMWGQIDNRAKITIAKEVVNDLLEDWTPSTELGLTVYGHRRKGDCSDIESLIPVAPVEAGIIKRAVASISPKGKTPLSKAVMQAADELKFTEEKATVILVSDGIETCDLDPCKVAEELEAKGLDFTAHVIGFDVKEKEVVAQLSCLAENTGGRFLSASNAAELKSSIAEAVKEVAKVNVTNVELWAVREPGGEPLENVRWGVHRAAEPEGPAFVYGRGPTPKYFLEPGEYVAVVHSVGGQAKAQKEIVVPEEGVVREEVVLAEEGLLQLVAVKEAGGKPLANVSWNVHTRITDIEVKKGENVAYGRGAQPEYLLLPGTYIATVRSVGGQASAEQEVEVLPGAKNRVEVILAEEGVLKLFAKNTPEGEVLDDVSWTVLHADSKQNVAYGKGAQPEYTLLPGKYIARVRSLAGKAQSEQEVQVVAGKKSEFEVLLPTEGIVELVAVHEAGGAVLENVSWLVNEISASGGSGSNVAYGKGARPEYKLLPGKYLASVRSRGGKAEAQEEIEVVAGKKSRIELVLAEEGILSLAAVTTAGGQPLKDVSWKIYTSVPDDSIESASLVAYGKGAQPEYLLLPGDYEAHVRSRKGMASAIQKVSVLPGKKERFEVLFPNEGEVELQAVTLNGPVPKRVGWEVYTVVPEGAMASRERVTYGGGLTKRFRLLPGKYLAIATAEQKKFEKEIEVLPGKVVTEKVVVSLAQTDEG